ncbi:ankyrin repeat domain-containing protein [Wolbachia endosymbiont of Pentalonia nigronervosa]|jgi:ankyrin repeat protein|uniref:ankyrin repeat domain-containing protein n=1 Tax=Wolbachia endosymbiont of Pentalonia nigronervosa TaxID=1301914 RepID=UPI00165FCDBF|nr:ankyrin repeat domain-containing protein [Wolbachia endosymbiont of Pentalonia nigronervosa]MBD0391455.1 ankyrin repeat domain-containing protein [Wolbachia endosymbiont of Pentalonia nigronervosa]
MDYEQWREILIAVNDDVEGCEDLNNGEGLNEVNVIEKIKEKLRTEYLNVYEKWQKNGFHVNYPFRVVYNSDSPEKKIYKQTLLRLAAHNNLEKLTSALEVKGGKIHPEGELYSWNALYAAVFCINKEVIDSILRAGEIQINARDKDDKTLLHLAAEKDTIGAVKVLIDKGADLNARDQDGKTPLHLAAERNKIGAVKILIEEEADLNARDKNGRTPLHFAASNGNADIVEILMDKGDYINVIDKDDRIPLHLAAESGNASTIEVLVDRGADLKAKDRDDRIPLHLAAENGNVGTIKALIRKRVDLNARDKNGRTPLHLAAKNDKVEIVNILIKKGANINAQDENGKTALQIADRNARDALIAIIEKRAMIKGVINDCFRVLTTVVVFAIVCTMLAAYAMYESKNNTKMEGLTLESVYDLKEGKN